MTTTLHIIGIGFLVMTCVWLFRILYVYRSIKKARTKKSSTHQHKKPIHIILPVLNEDRRLRDFVDHFKLLQKSIPSLELWLVTTEREKHQYDQSRTIEISEEFARTVTSTHHVHYPHTSGVVAHQLNYALDHIPNSGFTAIYNADSRPDKKTFEWVMEQDDSVPRVFQQYGIYTKNLKYLLSQPAKLILLANAYWQVRWSIGLEYYRAESSTRRHNWPWMMRAFSYCISHGLFVSTDVLKQIRFSETTINEDAIFGLEATIRNIDIEPIPYFDIAESPDSIRSIYEQKTNWYQGALQAPLYYRLVKDRADSKAKILFASLQQFGFSFYWILGPLFVMVAVILSIICVTVDPIYGLYLLAPLCFLVIPALASQLAINKLDGQEVPLLKVLWWVTTGATAAYFIHGIAGINGVFSSKRIALGHKLKTHMSQDGEM